MSLLNDQYFPLWRSVCKTQNVSITSACRVGTERTLTPVIESIKSGCMYPNIFSKYFLWYLPIYLALFVDRRHKRNDSESIILRISLQHSKIIKDFSSTSFSSHRIEKMFQIRVSAVNEGCISFYMLGLLCESGFRCKVWMENMTWKAYASMQGQF
jgi:hypothetical protein